MMAKGGGHQGRGRNPARGLCGGSQGRDAACLRGSVFPAEGEGRGHRMHQAPRVPLRGEGVGERGEPWAGEVVPGVRLCPR